MRYTMENAPIDVLKNWKQSFVYRSSLDYKWHASLETSTNALAVNMPSIEIGKYETREQANEAVQLALQKIDALGGK